MNGSCVGEPVRTARIQFGKGLGGEGSAGGEFCTCDFDGWDASENWGPHAKVRIVEPVHTQNDPNKSLYAIDGCPGDLLNDGTEDFDDLNPFIDAWSDPAVYQEMYAGLAGSWTFRADCNCDGILDFGDILAFVACLGQPCPHPEGRVSPGDEPRLSVAERLPQ